MYEFVCLPIEHIGTIVKLNIDGKMSSSSILFVKELKSFRLRLFNFRDLNSIFISQTILRLSFNPLTFGVHKEVIHT